MSWDICHIEIFGETMNVLKIESLNASFGEFSLKNISFSVEENTIMVLLGKNGAGKTKLLESIAGLEKISKGEIFLKGKNITNEKTQKRNIGVIFQHLGLFPHMSIKENLLYGLKAQKLKTSRIDEIIEIFNLSELIYSKPHMLSQGQKQRAALARAIIPNPDIIFFDESTSSISPFEKPSLLNEIKSILKSFKKSAIFVTHDIQETFEMANKVAIIENGKLIEIGDKSLLYNPHSLVTSSFLEYNVYDAHVLQAESNEVIIQNIKFYCAKPLKTKNIKCLIKPDDVLITLSPKNQLNEFMCEIIDIKYNGYVFIVMLGCGLKLKAFITKYHFEELSLDIGKKVYIYIKPEAISVINSTEPM